MGARMETAFQDIRYATRTLRRSPGFAMAAMLTIALGIGASTAIFSVAEAVLLRPLPYRDAGRLVYACEDFKTRGVYDHLWSGPNYMDLRDHGNASLEDVAAVSTYRNILAHDDGRPEEYVYAVVSPNIFRLLGIRVIAGRDFSEGDAQPEPVTADGAPPSVGPTSPPDFDCQRGVLPEAIWRQSRDAGQADREERTYPGWGCGARCGTVVPAR